MTICVLAGDRHKRTVGVKPVDIKIHCIYFNKVSNVFFFIFLVTEDDVDDDVICNDVISIEEMAYYSRCGAYYSALTSNPDCG